MENELAFVDGEPPEGGTPTIPADDIRSMRSSV